jgi:hypothetical protein
MSSSSLTTAVVVAANVAVCALVVAGIAYAARVRRRACPTAAAAPYVLAAAAVVAWDALAFVLARDGAFATTSDTTNPLIPLGIVVPTVAGVALLRVAAVRRAIERIPLQWLVGVQLYRVLGGLFLIDYARHEMPGEFALPAGIGDMLVGLAAVAVAALVAARGAERARTAVLTWCALGLADLVVALGTGFLSAPGALQQLAIDEPNAAITRYPFVLIPAFIVPVSIVLHVYVLARVRTRSAASSASVGRARAA